MRRLDGLAYSPAPPARNQGAASFLDLPFEIVAGDFAFAARHLRANQKQKELDMLATALLAATLGVAAQPELQNAQPELQNVNCGSYGYASPCDAYGYAPYYGYRYRRYVGPRRFGRSGYRGFYGNPDRTFGRHCSGASC
jgi:hypothetical protein